MKTTLFRNTLAALAALFIATFALPQQAQAENYKLMVAGTTVTSDNCNDLSVISGVSGTVKYDFMTNTLTLDNATIKVEGDWHGIMTDMGGLTILVKGTVNITTNKAKALLLRSSATITGDGTLNVMSINNYGISLNQSYLTIDGCTVNVKGIYGIRGDDGDTEKVTIRNANVTAEGTYGSICVIDDFILEGCAITQPAGAAFNPSIGSVALNGKRVKEKVVIQQKDIQAPSAPTITSMKSTTNSITVYWSKSTDKMTPQNELRYRVCYCVAGSGGYSNGSLVTNQTSYTVTGLDPDTEYELYVTALDNAGNSANSDKKTIRTDATSYGFMIAGTLVTSANCNDLSDLPGVSGTVKYDPATKTLTLEDATIVATGDNNGILGGIDGLTVRVKGTVNVTAQSYALRFESSATLTGDGTLNATGGISAYYTDLTIDGLTVNAKGIIGISGLAGYETLTIKNATVTAEGNGAQGSIRNFTTLTLDGCAITQPAGAAFDASIGSVALNGERVKTKVVIEPTGSLLYDVVLESYNSNKVACIKAVRDITGIGLKDAKELVESAPCIVVENLSKSEAEAARDKLNTAGGTANVYPHGTWNPNAIETVTADVPLKKQGTYTLHGVKLDTPFDRLPAGVYIYNGKKVVKK